MKGLLNAASLYESLQPISVYYDRHSNLSREEYTSKYLLQKGKVKNRLSQSQTLYIGNLSIYTTEEQIMELFNRVEGGVKRMIMGRNKDTGQAIGFCFIEYHNHDDAGQALEYLNLLKLDDRVIRVDWDIGYSEGREYGRGHGGYQVRDTYRKTADPERPNVQQRQSSYRGGRNRSYNNRRNDDEQEDQKLSDESGSDDERRKRAKRQGSRGQRRNYY